MNIDELAREIERLKAQSTPMSGPWHEIGGSGEPAFANSWANYGLGYNTCAFCLDGSGFVHLKGLVKDGTVPATVFTLPAGYRPVLAFIVATTAHYLYAVVEISAAGVVTAQAGSNAFFSLDGITFRAA